MKIALSLVALLLSSGLLAAPGYPPVTVDVAVTKVSEHSYYALGAAGTATENEGFISNAGFVITEAGVVVFDSLGSPSLAWTLRQRIRELLGNACRADDMLVSSRILKKTGLRVASRTAGDTPTV